MEIESLVQDALAHLGVEARLTSSPHDPGADLILDPDGAATVIELKRRSLVDDKTTSRLLRESRRPGAVLLVVGDRVTIEARHSLLEAGAGYLDLRGRMGLRANGIVISADVPAVREGRERVDALAGRAGLEVATLLLMEPAAPVAVRSLGRKLHRAPSTVSEVLGSLRRDRLVDKANVVADTALFWRVVEKWPDRRTYVAAAPHTGDPVTTQALRLGLADVEETSGWALTDTAAAAVYGAPVALRSGQELDFFVPGDSELQRATRLLGAVDSATLAGASIRVAPVPMATANRVDYPADPLGWPLAHPLFVALDLAQDVGRGREILDAWNPDERWTRVW